VRGGWDEVMEVMGCDEACACKFLMRVHRDACVFGRSRFSRRAFMRMKNLPKTLATAKRELNLLYTEPPAMRQGSVDEGWHAREHAYHTYFLLRLLGEEARLEIGHFALCAPGMGITTYETDRNHTWCVTAEVAPIDLSMELSYRPNVPQLGGPIVGAGTQNGPYTIHCFREAPGFEAWLDGPLADPSIGYLATAAPVPDAATLLDHPEQFFLPGTHEELLQQFGPEIFCRITMHVYKVAQGHVPPLAGKRDARSAFQHIRSHYPSSRVKIQGLLAGGSD
jgi:hypothetical protein